MDNSLKYVNHKKETIVWGEGSPYHYQDVEFHDWEYDYDVQMNEVVHMEPLAREFSMKSLVSRGTLEARNRMFEVLGADPAANVDGTLEAAGGWRLRCRVCRSEKDRWWADEAYMRDDLTFVAANPVWTRESLTSFGIVEDEDEQAEEGKGYPYGFPYDYRTSRRTANTVTSEFGECDFLLRVYGPCIDPYVIVGGNRHECAVSLAAGQKLEIDTRAKSATVVYEGGATSNAYPLLVTGSVDSGHYPFRKARAGENAVSWPGTFAFDIVLYDERSEPAWTA